jgi:deazaflavin-dependent oxidoreductase (nitroreductase family)
MMNRKDADSKIPDPPRGLKAIPWRLPVWLYRLKLGWLLGHRMLLLTHKGRISGKYRCAVLEVIKYDKTANIYYVASGFGEKSDWYRNIVKNPRVTIQSGSQKISAQACILPSDQARKVFLEYTHHHPNAIKNLARLVGYQVGDTKEEMMEFLALIPVVALHPIACP